MAGFRKSTIIRLGNDVATIQEAIEQSREHDKQVTVDIDGCPKNILAYRSILGGTKLVVLVRNLDSGNGFEFDCTVPNTDSGIKEAAIMTLMHVRFAKENSGS